MLYSNGPTDFDIFPFGVFILMRACELSGLSKSLRHHIVTNSNGSSTTFPSASGPARKATRSSTSMRLMLFLSPSVTDSWQSIDHTCFTMTPSRIVLVHQTNLMKSQHPPFR